MQGDAKGGGAQVAFALHQIKRFLFAVANTRYDIGLRMHCLGSFFDQLDCQAVTLRRLDGGTQRFFLGSRHFVHFCWLSIFIGHLNILDNTN